MGAQRHILNTYSPFACCFPAAARKHCGFCMKFYNPAHHRVITVKGWKFTMRRIISMLLCMGAAAVMTGCSASAEQHSGQAQGYGGVLRVSVEMDGADITRVTVQEHHETEGVGTRAIEALPDQIVQADSVEVDDVSGATRTSQAIKEAVRQAIGSPAETSMPRLQEDGGLLTGVGMAATGRVGPGKDDEGNQVYSMNVVFASGEFDDGGVIRAIRVDQLELVSPNLGGGNMFNGFPKGADGEDAFMKEVSAWQTKGMMGEDYMLASGSWREQMDAYEQAMVGKTVDEVKEWYANRGTNAADEATATRSETDATDASDAGAAQPVNDMADVNMTTTDAASSATMSLQGEYGDILLAIERAWQDAKGDTGAKVDTNTVTDATEGEKSEG